MLTKLKQLLDISESKILTCQDNNVIIYYPMLTKLKQLVDISESNILTCQDNNVIIYYPMLTKLIQLSKITMNSIVCTLFQQQNYPQKRASRAYRTLLFE